MAKNASINLDLGGNLVAEDEPKSKDRTWIVLDESDDIPPTGLYIGYNGTGYMLKAGVEAYVPAGLLGILDDAIQDAPVIDPQTRRTLGYKPKRRFGYRVVNRPGQ